MGIIATLNVRVGEISPCKNTDYFMMKIFVEERTKNGLQGWTRRPNMNVLFDADKINLYRGFFKIGSNYQILVSLDVSQAKNGYAPNVQINEILKVGDKIFEIPGGLPQPVG